MHVRDLLRHTAGLTYGFFGDTKVDQLYRETEVLGGDLNEMAAQLGKLPLLYDPGEDWVYSVATDVLGLLVERVSGKKLDVFFRGPWGGRPLPGRRRSCVSTVRNACHSGMIWKRGLPTRKSERSFAS